MPADTPTDRPAVRVAHSSKRVRAVAGGVVIADTVRPLLVWEHDRYPAYYLPLADVRTDLLVPSATVTHSETRGDAVHFTLKLDGDERTDAAWQYADSPVAELRDQLRFDWTAIDHWYEEDEEVFTHPRDPYTRVDVLPSSRRVRVLVDGVVVADSTRTHALHETGHRVRWYFPAEDVRMDLLERTDHSTHCPYKGQAEYWSVRVGDRLAENVVWSYRDPLPESARVAGLLAFYDERVELITDEGD